MGDKTQIATIALASRHQDFFATVIGTTLGMLLAKVPAVLFGQGISRRLPTRWFQALAALIFCVNGIATLMGPATPSVCEPARPARYTQASHSARIAPLSSLPG